MQDLLDVMNGEVPLEVIDEIGTDNDSLKDNSTLNMSEMEYNLRSFLHLVVSL
jgi:hypothetical protein